MRITVSRILVLGMILTLLLPIPVQPAAMAQPTGLGISICSDMSVGAQSALAAVGQPVPPVEPNALQAGAPRANDLAGTVLAAAARSLSTTSNPEAVAMDWRPMGLTARYWHTMAYDSARGVVVLFGGFDGGRRDDTWEWDGINWLKRSPVNHPSAREGQSMAYDSVRGVVVLFGGFNAGYYSDTWEWDGTNWVERNPLDHPSPRLFHAMAYDSARGVVVLFGGTDTVGYQNDTWEWDGTNWVQRSPASSPPARNNHAMVYDSARGQVVLFGGRDASGDHDDTWEWNGTNWVQRTPSTHPPTMREHAMAYDSTRGVTVLFGGCCYYYDTWEWNGSNWVLRTPASHPAARDGHAMAYDSARGVVVLYGGYSGGRVHDTWEWNGTSWVDRGTPNHPSPRSWHTMAYDSARDVTVLFGGTLWDGQNHFQGDTWEWDGMAWEQRNPANSPSARAYHAMAYDSLRGVTVLFGGWDANGFLADTWEWDGTNWLQRSPTHHPTAREGHAMVYDSARGVVVLFGGQGDGFQDDTWEWNGTDWQQRSPVTRPSARHWFAMTYDSARGVAVLFGGWDGWFEDDTWEWNGTDWAQRTDIYPPASSGHAMAYDSGRGVTVLWGGSGPDRYYTETWEWDGTNWAQNYPVNRPPARGSHAMAYHSSSAAVILFGGHYAVGAGQYFNDTWEYGPLVSRPILAPIDNDDGDGEYLVDWSTVSEAISYTLEEDDNAAFSSPTVRYLGDQTQFQVTGQGAGDWYYRVKASNVQGDSPWSNVEMAGVQPEAPTLYPIDNGDGDGTYLVDWSDAAGATAYELQEDDNGAFTSPVVRYTGATSQYQVNSQQGGTWYYRVRATNAGGNSPWSNIESVGVVPAAPVLLAISNPDGDGDYLVDWNDVPGATSYRLEEGDDPGFISPTVRYMGDSSQYQVNGQQGGTWYYRVRASNQIGDGLWSNTESVSVIPAAPVLLPISNPGGSGDYLVDWNSVTGTASYRLEEDDNSAFTSPTVRYTGINSQYQVSAQPVGLWYYRVQASNPGGDSPWSNIETVTVTPAVPVLFPISNPDGNGDYLVNWSEVTGATSYRLEEDADPTFISPTVRYEGINGQYQVNGQPAGTWYYRVRASEQGWDSPWSNTESVGVIPAAPDLFPIDNPDGNGYYVVDWDDTVGASGYELQEDDNSGFASPVTRYQGAATQLTVTHQQLGTWYYRVRAYNVGGGSPWSVTRDVTVTVATPWLVYLPAVLRGFVPGP